MMSIKFKINDFGPISETNMEIGKINVVGGLNATGKSTASKLLYCFLKGCTFNRKRFAYSLIPHQMSNVSDLSDNSTFNSFKGNVKRLVEEFEPVRSRISKSNDSMFNSDSILKKIEDDENLYKFILEHMIHTEFSSGILNGYASLSGVYKDESFDFSFDVDDEELNCSAEGNLLFNNVYYFDSISVFDEVYLRMEGVNKNNSFVNFFNDRDEPDGSSDDEINNKVMELQDKLEDIINGKFESNGNDFVFISNDGYVSAMGDTSSGIKQIGIIQTLLLNHKLKEDSFLIIDEPEEKLHPELQIKFAEVLVLFAKELNIFVYLNSNSPMFIEAISLYSQYYDLLEDTNFYLTREHGKGYTFEKIDSKDMGAVYENLTAPYDILDDLKAKILFKE